MFIGETNLWLHIQLAPFWKEITFFSTFKSQEWTKSIFFFYYHNQEKSWWKCVVPENIHSPPTEGIGNSWGVEGGSQRPKNLSKCLNLDWNFQRGGGGGDLRKNPFCGGHMDNCWKHTINFMITYFNGKFFNFETNSLYGDQSRKFLQLYLY